MKRRHAYRHKMKKSNISPNFNFMGQLDFEPSLAFRKFVCINRMAAGQQPTSPPGQPQRSSLTPVVHVRSAVTTPLLPGGFFAGLAVGKSCKVFFQPAARRKRLGSDAIDSWFEATAAERGYWRAKISLGQMQLLMTKMK
ncbi:dual specificity protein phosphatase 6 [Lates japonicus]|uniref:Dual specificity protein phosphatase 6 n=1 Tax=Lates japonicus TaxID=270547 RepID=A0AAD3R901_LATJO|nr:dual specificity protein phosphatase 6 [Lates japonicus]